MDNSKNPETENQNNKQTFDEDEKLREMQELDELVNAAMEPVKRMLERKMRFEK